MSLKLLKYQTFSFNPLYLYLNLSRHIFLVFSDVLTWAECGDGCDDISSVNTNTHSCLGTLTVELGKFPLLLTTKDVLCYSEGWSSQARRSLAQSKDHYSG